MVDGINNYNRHGVVNWFHNNILMTCISDHITTKTSVHTNTIYENNSDCIFLILCNVYYCNKHNNIKHG